MLDGEADYSKLVTPYLIQNALGTFSDSQLTDSFEW